MLTVTSTAFVDGGRIPAKFCAKGVKGGSNVSPQIARSTPTPPEGTRSIVVTRHALAPGSVTGVFGR